MIRRIGDKIIIEASATVDNNILNIHGVANIVTHNLEATVSAVSGIVSDRAKLTIPDLLKAWAPNYQIDITYPNSKLYQHPQA